MHDLITKLTEAKQPELQELAKLDNTVALAETTARILWHLVLEPADQIAGEYLEMYGAKTAWEKFIAAQNSPKERRIQEAAFAQHQGAENTNALTYAMRRWYKRVTETDLEELFTKTLNTAKQAGMLLLTPGQQHWPGQLQDLGTAAPVLLWVQGAASVLQTRSIAVVGARAIDNYAEKITQHFTQKLAAAGFTIVSGAAYGVDAIAHHTALANGAKTIAVFAGGLDRIYPRGHSGLIKKIIAAGGAVCSEMPPGAAPTRWRFLQRNRIIAALSYGTLVTAAALRSGSINTAGHAAAIGRTLAAVPGNIDSFNTPGCHKLIREYGAEMVINDETLKEAFDINNDFLDVDPVDNRELSIHTRVCDAISLKHGISCDKIAAGAGISLQECTLALAELEMLGKVTAVNQQSQTLWQLKR